MATRIGFPVPSRRRSERLKPENLRSRTQAAQEDQHRQDAIISKYSAVSRDADPAASMHSRGVAQPGRAPGSGPGGRRFKSSLPDHLFSRPFNCSRSLGSCFGFAFEYIRHNREPNSAIRSRFRTQRPFAFLTQRCFSPCRSDRPLNSGESQAIALFTTTLFQRMIATVSKSLTRYTKSSCTTSTASIRSLKR